MRKRHGLKDPDEMVLLAHGGGGMLTRKLIEEIILGEFGNPILAPLDDAACISMPGTELTLTTDSYVVNPVFFPGGDIGKLAVCGTVNDLVMQGSEPKFLSLALIIEEGFLIRDLRRIIHSAGEAARSAGVLIVTGDTKVIERRGGQETGVRGQETGVRGQGTGVRGQGTEDRGETSELHAPRSTLPVPRSADVSENSPAIFLNTSGIGVRLPGVDVAVRNARPGDAVIVTGTIGDHGIAVMSAREGFGLQSGLVSDVQPLWALLKPVLEAFPGVHCLRDPTRGGLAAGLCDIARSSGCGIRIREKSLPVRPEVRGSCGILGLDPLNVANEGKAVLVCSGADAARILDILRAHPAGVDACVIGKAVLEPRGMVLLETPVGGERIVDIPMGEDLPRIC